MLPYKKQDIVEFEGEYRGFRFYITIHPYIGHRCGYIIIPSNCCIYQRDYSTLKIEAHGGLTYSGFDFEDKWVIGFDCAHIGDAPDIKAALKFYKNTEYEESIKNNSKCMYGGKDDEIRTLDYCIDECKKIIDQILEKENLNNE